MADDELNWFLHWLAPRVSFDITPDVFTVRANDASITIPTYLYVRKATGGQEIVSVGEDPAALNDAYRVDLFGGHEPPIDGPDKLDYLDAYFRYILSRGFANKWWFVRPVIVVRGVDRLANAVGGYQRSLIREALSRAGASSIRFE